MNRNSSLFSVNPVNIDISRTRFNRDFRNSTTFDVGKLIPFYCDEVLPDDTFDVDTTAMVRFSSPLDVPILDDLFIDFYYFFVPMRLTWEHSKEFFGENNESAWIPSTEYTIPRLFVPHHTDSTLGKIIDGYDKSSPMGYMGVPLYESGISSTSITDNDIKKIYYNALPMRAYCLIWNHFFRNQNVQDPVYVPLDDTDRMTYTTHTDLTAYAFEGNFCLPVDKTHDYFTSCLPGPQKGPAVSIPMLTNAQVFADNVSDSLSFSDFTDKYGTQGITFYRVSSSTSGQYIPTSDESKDMGTFTGTDGVAVQRVGSGNITVSPNAPYLVPFNLKADLGSATATTINELREAFQLQKFFEKLARGGSRYIEIVKSFFNVDSADSRVQIPEYLGGSRQYLNIQQVVQTSSTDSTSPQGNLTAISQTPYSNKDFIKSFTEHGFVLGVCCVRYDHKYADGVDKMWRRRTKFDFYWPVFANLGEQAVKLDEIYSRGWQFGDNAFDPTKATFGYQERYAEYRYKRSYASGHFATDLKMWTLTDFYGSRPYLSNEWMCEDKSNVDRALAVTSENVHQVFADIYIQNKCTRAMPLHSIPGLIDHH